MSLEVLERDQRWLSDEFKSSFMLALALHVFIVMVGFITGRILGVISLDRNEALEILSASVRVDVVGMPKLTLEELRQRELPTTLPEERPVATQASQVEEREAPIKPSDLVVPEEKKTKPSLSSFLQNYSDQKVKVAPRPKEGEPKGQVAGLDGLIIEGNRLSKGTALTGQTSDLADSAYVGYVQTLPAKVHAQWRLPGYLKEQQLKCKVHIWIGPQGELLKLSLRESSGNADYDGLAEGAIRAAAPFAPPPSEATEKLANRGIILGFPLI